MNTYGETKKEKRRLTSREKAFIVILVLIIAFAATWFITFKGGLPGDVAAANSQSQTVSVEPIKTTGDTDSKRRYGYDVLYAHKNLRIMLRDSYTETSDPLFVFDIINDSKKDMNVQLACCSLDNMWFDMNMDCTVKSHNTATDNITIHKDIFATRPVEVMRLCFKITNLEDGSVTYSEPILAKYLDYFHEPGWSITNETVSRLEADGFELLSSGYNYDVGTTTGVMENLMYIQNDCFYDVKYHVENVALYDADENVIPSEDYEMEYEGVVPGYSLYDNPITINMNKDPERLKRIRYICFDFVYEYLNDTEERGEIREPIVVSHRID